MSSFFTFIFVLMFLFPSINRILNRDLNRTLMLFFINLSANCLTCGLSEASGSAQSQLENLKGVVFV